jgi:hypothetical protein
MNRPKIFIVQKGIHLDWKDFSDDLVMFLNSLEIFEHGAERYKNVRKTLTYMSLPLKMRFKQYNLE